jgi:hypothetical protein
MQITLSSLALAAIVSAALAQGDKSPASQKAPETGRLELSKYKDLKDVARGWGGWRVMGDAALDPDNEKKLLAKEGEGVLFTGGGRDLVTIREFGDCVMHAEFMVPKGGNSGIYFMGRYELQIYDSFGVEKDKYPGIENGGIYPRAVGGKDGHSPKVNVSKAPGQWQTFDVVFRAPRFDAEGKKTANARFVKVVHNGQVIHENVEVTGPTALGGPAQEKPSGPVRIQGDHGPVAFRNVWIEPAE